MDFGGGGGGKIPRKPSYSNNKAGVPNAAALERHAAVKKRLDAGFLGRESEVGLNLSFDLPPFWSTTKHGMPVTGGDVVERTFRASCADGSAKQKVHDLRARLENNDPPQASGAYRFTTSDRVKLINQLPPHDAIVSLARGLDNDPDTQNWTGDELHKFKDDLSLCVRRAIGKLEQRMRHSLTAKVLNENQKSMSPAWREKDFLLRVFQRVDLKRHGVVTGDCDIKTFAKVWGVPLRSSSRKDEDEDDLLEHLERVSDDELGDVEVVHDENMDNNVDGVMDSTDAKDEQPSNKAVSKTVTIASSGKPSVPLRRRKAKDPSYESVALVRDDSSSDATPIEITRNSVAALFVKYGYDKDGFMPYEVFINALLESPSRLLAMETNNSLKETSHGYSKNDDPTKITGKILYPKCRNGVFPPNEFSPELVKRSTCAPEAELELEHAYGYAGSENTSSNVFYLMTGEIVYYTAAICVVLDKDKLEKRQKCQRFFFGHTEDITCLAVHPNREWVASGQVGKTPYFCVWDAVTMLQLQKIMHPSGLKGIAALAFSQHDGGDTITTVNSDKEHTVFVWRWSKEGDDAALDRSKNASAWRFGPSKQTKKHLEFYEPEGGSHTKSKKAATASLSKAELQERYTTSAMGEVGGMGKQFNTSYELLGEGVGLSGLPPAVNGVAWNPFPNSNEFITFGVKHLKVWRAVDLSDAKSGFQSKPRWVGELARWNDSKRVADCSVKMPRFVNTGEPGGGFVEPPTPDPEDPEFHEDMQDDRSTVQSERHSERGSQFDDQMSPGKASLTESAREKGKASLNKSMTSLSSFSKGKGLPEFGGKATNKSLTRNLSANVRASFAKLNVDGGVRSSARGKIQSGKKINESSAGENVVAATYVRNDVIVTGFPNGGLGVWKVNRWGINGEVIDPGLDVEGNQNNVTRWTCLLVQRIADAHAPGPKIHLNDGTSTFGGVRCLNLRGDGATLLTGGADGWIHTWSVTDGPISVVSDPKKTGERGVRHGNPKIKKVQAVVLNRVCRDLSLGETAGPNSWRFQSAYPGEQAPAMRSLDCRPKDVPGTGKKRVATKDKGKIPREFLFGTDKCDVWEVEYKDGEDEPQIGVQVYGHLAELSSVATHPRDPNVFASTSDTRVFLWNATDRNLTRTSSAGGVFGSIVAISQDPVAKSEKYFPGWQPFLMKKMGTSTKLKMEKANRGHHLAVGGKHGGISILDGVTLQPLCLLKGGKTGPKLTVSALKYCGEPRQMLAAGSHDLVVDIYDASNGYTRLHRCGGHQASITHLDWSLPEAQLNNTRVLQSACASFELLYWDPISGKQIKQNQRDARWETWTSTLGFPVMGIWGEGSDGGDIHALARAGLGQPFATGGGVSDDAKKSSSNSTPENSPVSITNPEGDRGLPHAGYCVTADVNGAVKLFNYPCVANNAPYREYKGHASHATCVAFTADDGRVITAGARDRAMLQYITKGVRVDEEKPEYEAPAQETREWGPIDGGKSYGWIDPVVDENESDPTLNADGTEKRIAPPRPEPPMANVGVASDQ